MATTLAIIKAKKFIEEHNFDKSHNFSHAMAVLAHVQRMVLHHKKPLLNRIQLEDLNLAAILHDVDDKKFFPDNANFENARQILCEIFPNDWCRIEFIIHLIELVSTTKNGNVLPDNEENIWMLYPRFADRLEAIGKVGIKRCVLYSIYIDRPLALPTTPKCATEEELWKVATPERFQTYLKVKESESVVDHIYDKLLHIGSPEVFKRTNNAYLINEAAHRHKYMIDIVLDFGKTGKILF